MCQKLGKEDFEDEWTVCEWKGRVYCLVRIYYVVGECSENNPPLS